MKIKLIAGFIAVGLSLNANAFIGDETGPCIYEALLYNEEPYLSCAPLGASQWTHELEKEFQELVDEITAEMGDLVGSREGMEPEDLEDPYAEYWEEEVTHVSDEPDFAVDSEVRHVMDGIYVTVLVFTATEDTSTLKEVVLNRGNCPLGGIVAPNTRSMLEQIKTRLPVTAKFGEDIVVGVGNCNVIEFEFTTERGSWSTRGN